jgi:amino acid adenylation domain-containing protein
MDTPRQFWTDYLHGFTAPTPLPPNPKSDSPEGLALSGAEGGFGHQRFTLPPETSRALAALARQHRLTPNTIMQGAWALLLSRYCGERDIVFGATVSGRPAEIAGVEKMVGVFINTLPVRIGISPEAHLLPWLANIQREQAPIRALEHSPLVDVQGWSGVPRGQQLFESILVFSNYPQDVPFTEGIDSSLKMDNFRAIEQTGYPLTILITPGERWLVMLDYHRARLSDEAITRLARHLQTLLESMAARPESRLSELAWLTPAELRQLDGWNATAAAYPAATLHALIEQQAARTPNKIAVSAGGEALTYRELDERATILAAHLSALGVGPESLVGICTRRGVGMLAGLLGILKAGAAYVPLDPDYPADRLAYILQDSAARLILTDSTTHALIANLQLPVTNLVNLDHLETASPSGDPAPPRTHAESLCYVIHTSGSTGKPKGVQIPHRAAVNFMTSMAGITGLAADVLLAVTTLSFDIAGLELYLPLTLGGQVVIASREQAADGLALAALLETSGATAMQATPATWRMLVDSGWRGKPGLKILCGGEALPRDLADELLRRGASVLNLYGPTETTIWSASYPVQAGAGSVPIGKPVANTQLYLLDDDLRRVPVGVAGNLYIGGDGMARGYLNKPGLTAERFVPNPFFAEEKEKRREGEKEQPLPSAPTRLYKTGDMARWLPSGEVEFLGRADFQVKLRGFRVELEEIELALRAHPAVLGAVVLVREDQPGDQRLVGYVIPRDGAPPPLADLRAFLGGSLPPYMIPSNFIFLPEFPLTPNGKIDRKALPAPEGARPDLGAAYAPPRSELERTITAIWQDVLRVEQVGVHDNFFDLGGHSLLMVQVFGKLRAALSADLSMVELFRFPTVRAMAESLGGGAVAPSRVDESADRAALRRAALGRRRG